MKRPTLSIRSLMVGIALFAILLSAGFELGKWYDHWQYCRSKYVWYSHMNGIGGGPMFFKQIRFAYRKEMLRKYSKAAWHPYQTIPPDPTVDEFGRLCVFRNVPSKGSPKGMSILVSSPTIR